MLFLHSRPHGQPSDVLQLILPFVVPAKEPRQRHSLAFPSVQRPFFPRVLQTGQKPETPPRGRRLKTFAASSAVSRTLSARPLVAGRPMQREGLCEGLCEGCQRSHWELHSKRQLFKSAVGFRLRVHKYPKVEAVIFFFFFATSSGCGFLLRDRRLSPVTADSDFNRNALCCQSARRKNEAQGPV